MSGGGLVLGIDLATAAVRVLAVDLETGDVVATAGTPLPEPSVPGPGQQEQEPRYASAVRSGMPQRITSAGTRMANTTRLAQCVAGSMRPSFTGAGGRAASSAG